MPTYESISKKFEEQGLAVIFAKVNYKNAPKYVATYDIASTPSLLFIKNGDSIEISYEEDEEKFYEI